MRSGSRLEKKGEKGEVQGRKRRRNNKVLRSERKWIGEREREKQNKSVSQGNESQGNESDR